MQSLQFMVVFWLNVMQHFLFLRPKHMSSWCCRSLQLCLFCHQQIWFICQLYAFCVKCCIALVKTYQVVQKYTYTCRFWHSLTAVRNCFMANSYEFVLCHLYILIHFAFAPVTVTVLFKGLIRGGSVFFTNRAFLYDSHHTNSFSAY